MDSHGGPRDVTLKPKAPPAALLNAARAAKRALPAGEGHVTLFEDKITVRDSTADEELPRRYTLTHDDRTGDIVLAIGKEYDAEAPDRPQTGRRREEVRAELTGGGSPSLQLICPASAEAPSGQRADPATRRRTLEKQLPFVLAVIRYGDRFFYERHPDLDQASTRVEFRSTDPCCQSTEEYGRVADYRVTRIAGESRRLMFGAAALAALGIGAVVVGMRRK